MTTIHPILILALASLTMLTCGNSNEEADTMITTDFEFTSGNKILSGVIDQPANSDAKALIIFVHGSGPTDIRRENRYIDLRSKFT